MRKYTVSARSWDDAFQIRFGNRDSEHDLSDKEVVESIIKYGRAEITPALNRPNLWSLEFQNNYD